MNPTAELRDIHLPTEVGQWPLAYGWWLLAVLTVVTVVTLVVWWVKQRRLKLARRQALAALKTITSEQADWPVQLNQLLKRLAISYFPQQRVASLHSAEWIQFMSEQLSVKKREVFSQTLSALNQALYQPQADTPDFTQSQAQAALWIKSVKPTAPLSRYSEAAHV